MKNIDEVIYCGLAGDTTAANLFLCVNPFCQEFTTSIAPTTLELVLPDMRGCGICRCECVAISRESATELIAAHAMSKGINPITSRITTKDLAVIKRDANRPTSTRCL